MTKFLLYKERASLQICIGRFTDFTVLKSLVDRTALLLAAVPCDFDSKRYFNQESLTKLKFSSTNSVFLSEFGLLSVQARSTKVYNICHSGSSLVDR